VLKCPDDRKNRVVSAQATHPCGSSAVGGRVCEQWYAAEPVLPESSFELQHTGSPSKETALEEKAQAKFLCRSFGAGGVGGQEIAEAARTELWAGRGAARRALDRVHPDFDTSTFEGLVASWSGGKPCLDWVQPHGSIWRRESVTSRAHRTSLDEIRRLCQPSQDAEGRGRATCPCRTASEVQESS
jgi:hypothetical protein